ncbi:MAG: poly-beta-1,6 N-acetyl-D-glucosamine export porin PgaA [Gammaproteobacteria bacterium]|nr:poly-beta-1,6 N-acetyl-D-glucosamine export porin PgaA [Gammaproteobacteria bacterium]NNC97434.1 poly-beta-1,6 N-acetyl-D-glucosamine export porin PgaA [Gammaproteobacteria bacterium]NNM13907.1 poly-beta-1,6 N-acetyl-D-glucosamine export porin PgaA [Gammaproteobacteria bacterium]
MIKRTLITLISLAVFVLAIYYALNTNFYTSEQLDEVRSQAILKARDGDYDYALRRLEVLIKYDQNSRDVWYDYFTVLQWSGQDAQALDTLEHIDLGNAPDYFIESSLALVSNSSAETNIQQLSKLFDGLLSNTLYRDSGYLARMHAASLEAELETEFITSLDQFDSQHPLLQKIWLDKTVDLARSGDVNLALEQFSGEFPDRKNDLAFVAEYLTVLNWARDHEQVTDLATDYAFNDLPEYAQLAVADSFQAIGDLNSSLVYFTSLNENFPKPEYIGRVDTTNKLIAIAIQNENDRQQRLLQQKIAQQKKELAEKKHKIALARERWFQNASFSEINKELKKYPNSQKYYDRWELLAKDLTHTTGTSKLSLIENNLDGHPQDSLIYQNYVTQLSWDEQYQKAIDVFNQLPNDIEGKAYFYEAVAVAARHTDNPQLALMLYTKLPDESFTDSDIILGKALALQKLNNPDSVISLLRGFDKKKLNLDLLYSLADAYREKNDWGNGLATLESILNINPLEQRALQGKATILIDNNLPFQANAILQKHPEIIDRETELAIHAAMNTYAMREAADDNSYSEQQSAIETAKIINNNYLDVINNGDAPQKTLINAKADKTLLDYLSKDHEKVITSYQNSVDTTPVYILNEVASSYLALKKPVEALQISEKKLAIKNDDFSSLSNAYFASLELSDFHKANDFLKRMDKYIPKWIYSADGERSIENPRRESVELMLAMHQAYINNLPAAQLSLEKLVAIAPANNEYRTSLATIYRWRGWPERALEELNIVANSDRGYLPREVAESHIQIDQNARRDAAKKVAELSNTYPKNEAVIQLQERWQLENLQSVYISGDYSDSDGSNFSSQDQNLSIEWLSKPLNHHWRALVFSDLKMSQFSNSDETVSYTGTGLNYRDAWGDFTAKIYNVSGLDSLGLSLESTVVLNDHFDLSLKASSFSTDTPLRAIIDKVKSRSFAAGLDYRANERSHTGIYASIDDFSDNNKRTNLALNAGQTLFENEKNKWSLFESLYWQSNSENTNRNYFNPDKMLSASIGFEYSSNIYKYYERSFTHRIRLESGFVNQDDFSSKPALDLMYFHDWELSRRLNLNYGLGYRSTYYDGLKESGPKIHFGLGYKF